LEFPQLFGSEFFHIHTLLFRLQMNPKMQSII
jgi:hypothetical protein